MDCYVGGPGVVGTGFSRWAKNITPCRGLKPAPTGAHDPVLPQRHDWAHNAAAASHVGGYARIT